MTDTIMMPIDAQETELCIRAVRAELNDSKYKRPVEMENLLCGIASRLESATDSKVSLDGMDIRLLRNSVLLISLDFPADAVAQGHVEAIAIRRIEFRLRQMLGKLWAMQDRIAGQEIAA